MTNSARIDAIRALGGLGWITSLRGPAARALAEGGALQLSLFDAHPQANTIVFDGGIRITKFAAANPSNTGHSNSSAPTSRTSSPPRSQKTDNPKQRTPAQQGVLPSQSTSHRASKCQRG